MKIKIRSRDGKKQILAYLNPNHISAIQKMAVSKKKTIQRLLAEALTLAIEKHGRSIDIDPGQQRVIKNTNQSLIKNNTDVPKCRKGKRIISGWYPTAQTEEIGLIAHELECGIQNLVEEGVLLLLLSNKASKRK